MKSIILLHGAIGAADQLQPLANLFSAGGLQVHVFSFSGHGKIPFEKQFGIEQFSNELKAFILSNKIERPHVFGYSMGGYVALHLARTNPDLIGKIITLATKFAWTPETAQKELKMLNPEMIEEKVPKFALALKERHGEGWKNVLSKTAEMMISLGENNLLNEAALAEIKSEVMVGVGDKDNMVSIDETERVYTKLVNGNFFVLPNTKHPIEGLDNKLASQIALRFINAEI